MKKQIITGIAIIACIALCAAVWQRNAGVQKLPAEPIKADVNAEIEARSEEIPQNIFSEVTPALETEVVAESKLPTLEKSAEKETEKPAPTQAIQAVKPAPSSTEPHNGDVRVVNNEKQIYFFGFGWIKDEGGGSIGTMVGSPGDQLTGHKVGVMGGAESAASTAAAQQSIEPEITGDVIYTELQQPVTKDSTPPAYKPNGEPYNP